MKIRKFLYSTIVLLMMSFSFAPAQAAVNEFNNQAIIQKILTQDKNYSTIEVPQVDEGRRASISATSNRIQYRSLCGYTIWDGKSPKSCKDQYRIYKITANAPLLVFQITNGTKIDAAAIKRGYESAQRWCSNNSLTCNVLVSVGVTILAGLLI